MDSAKEMVAGSQLIKKSRRYKTLFYGLRLNHPHHVAVVYPLMDTLRRLFYALAIVFFVTVPLFGIHVLLIGTMATLWFAVTEWPWKDPLIN